MTAPSTLAIALGLALAALWVVAVHGAWRAWQPARLLRAGRHAEARAAADRLARSWLRVLPSARISARYVTGCALHLEGDLDGAIAALAPLHGERLRPDLRRAIGSVEAACHVLGDGDLTRAEALLATAAARDRTAEDLLLAALTKHGLGRAAEAERLLAEANDEPRRDAAIFRALRGLLLKKLGRPTEAQRDFEIAAKHPRTTVYVTLARTMLDASSPDGEGPSSLAPQVVEKTDTEGPTDPAR